MARIRIGKDITFLWSGIKTNGQDLSLSGRELALRVTFPNGKKINVPFEVKNTNSIEFTFKGIQQEMLGTHSVTLWENTGKGNQNALDKLQVVELVSTTDEEDLGNIPNNLALNTITLSGGELVVGFTGVGIQSIAQVQTSTESEGVNKWEITLTNGVKSTLNVLNGKQGTQGKTPVITTSKVGSVTTILADGVAIGTINDGEQGNDYVLTDNDKTTIATICSTLINLSNYVQKDGNKVLSTNDLTNELKAKIEGALQALPADVVRDANYVHTDNNYSNADKTKVQNIPTLLSQLDNDANFVQDANYQHTDNNYTNADKSSVQNISQLSQSMGTFQSSSHASVCSSIESIESNIGNISQALTTILGTE